jgi:hypothetical protein
MSIDGQRIRSAEPVRTGWPARRILPATAAVVLLGAVACTSSKPAAANGTSKSSTGSSTAAAGSTSGAAAGGTSAPAGSSPSPSSTDKAPKKDIIAGLITFKGKLKFSGAQSVGTSFSAFPGVTSPKSSCARIGTAGTPVAKGHDQQFTIPSPPEGDTVTIVAKISPYRGPGTYRKASLVTVGPSITVGSSTYNLRAAAAVVTVTVGANGSGNLAFTQAAASQSGHPALSGEIQWTCAVQS